MTPKGASQESNRVPPPALPTRSEDHSTMLFSPQKIASVKISYVSKIENVCGRARRGFFRAQNSAFGFFRTQNSEFLCFQHRNLGWGRSGTGRRGKSMVSRTRNHRLGIFLRIPRIVRIHRNPAQNCSSEPPFTRARDQDDGS